MAAVLTPADRHLVSRFSFGLTPALTRQVRSAGRFDWFERQLRPSVVADDFASGLRGWWPHLDLPPGDLWQQHLADTLPSWVLMADYGSWVLARRIHSQRQVFEVMVAFWESHLHIPYGADGFVWRVAYGDVVRRHALGRYADLLEAAVTHPAMLVWLDAAKSSKQAPNENLGRELLELFTVGVGNYTEPDVKNAARVLTGWYVDLYRTWAASYRPEVHHVGPVQVGTFQHPNDDPDGRAVTRALLQHLARQPATAERLALRLATKFVRDDPPPTLVARLAKTYLEHDTAIVPVLRELVRSPEFRSSELRKLRNPEEDVVATYRALGAKLERPVDSASATRAMVWQTRSIGLQIGDWPRPDGAPLTDAPWATTLRALASASVHRTVANGWWPGEDQQVRYPAAVSWVPRFPIRLDDLVDHVARRLLGRPATAAMVETACLALARPPGERIKDRRHPLVQWQMGTLLTALLDSPAHYFR